MTKATCGTPEFWRLYRALLVDVRLLAQNNYRLWSGNAFHPSLHFKRIGKPTWSTRVEQAACYSSNAFCGPIKREMKMKSIMPARTPQPGAKGRRAELERRIRAGYLRLLRAIPPSPWTVASDFMAHSSYLAYY